MMPFEYSVDGHTFMDYDAWHRWRDQQESGYWRPDGRFRFDIELAHPRWRLNEVPTERNPHNLGGFGPHTCFYSCREWSSIFGVHDAHHPSGESLRMVVESGHPDPVWGERIRLMSTSSYLEDIPWGTNPANRFAFFRGRYWRVTNFEPMQHESWRGTFPLSNLAASYICHPLAMPPELLFKEVTRMNAWYPGVFQRIDSHPSNSDDWYMGRYRPLHGDHTHTINLGMVWAHAWVHQSEVTDNHQFLSVAPTPETPFPENFMLVPDGEVGILCVSEPGAVEYKVKRIASGVDGDRTVHFELLDRCVTQPIQAVQAADRRLRWGGMR